jgi:tRNA-dihydrouridine synthase A
MLGRAAYQAPAQLADVDRRFFGRPSATDLVEALERYAAYAERARGQGTPMATLARPLIGLFQAQAGARGWRRVLTEESRRPGAGPEVIVKALGEVTRIRVDA